jgi:Circularly permutated YpsA SLOG family
VTLTIIAGGSPGAERGALQAAIDLGLPIAGWRTADDIALEIFSAHLRVTSGGRGMARRLCIQDSDGTLALSSSIAPIGVVAFADRTAEAMGRPFMSVTLGHQMPEEVRASVLDWMRDEGVARLCVTGPDEDDEPGVQGAVRKVVTWLLEAAAAEELREFTRVQMGLLEGLVDSDQPKGAT